MGRKKIEVGKLKGGFMKTETMSEAIRLYRSVLKNDMMPEWVKFIRSKSPLVSVDEAGEGRISLNCNPYWVLARFETVRGFGGCVADHYREEVLDLIKDPIVMGMALNCPAEKVLENSDAMIVANRHYAEKGGTRSHSMGGVINAIRALLLGGIQKRTPADKLKSPWRK